MDATAGAFPYDKDVLWGSSASVSTQGALLLRLADRTVTEVNDAFCSMFGSTRQEILHDSTRSLYASVGEFDQMMEMMDAAVNAAWPTTVERTLRRTDGSMFPAEVTVMRAPSSDGEALVLKIVRDLTEGKARQEREVKNRQREAFLSEASTLLLRQTLDLEETLENVAKLAARAVCDYANVNLIDVSAGTIRRVTIAHADPRNAELIRIYSERYPPREVMVDLIRALPVGGHLLSNDISQEDLANYATREGELEILQDVGLKHNLAVPLVGRDGVFGVIGFTRASGEPFDVDDVELAKELTARAALAYDNAALHRRATMHEARWRSLVEHAPDFIYLADADGTILHINRVEDGFEPADVEGRSLYSWLDADDAAAFRAVLAAVFVTAKPGALDIKVTIAGATKHYECRVAPVIREGVVVAATIATRDVTDRKRVDEELRRTSQDLRDFVETSAIGLHWVGPDGRIIWANRADHAMLGFTKDEYLGQNIRDFHADPHVIEDILIRLGRDERLHEYPARLKAKDGSICHVLIDSSVLWSDGKFIHTRCFTRDVTAQRVAEERVRAGEERLRRILETAPVQVLTVDETGRILTINRQGAEADPGKIVGRSLYENVVPEDRARARENVERVIRTGVPAEYELRRIVAPGEIRWFNARVGPLDIDGVKGAVLVHTDIEERKKIQDEIASVRAKLIGGEKLAALGSLVSGVAHELRTPLTYLSNNAFLLQYRLEKAAKEQQSAGEALETAKGFIAEITSGVDRINLLVEDLRRYTKARRQTALVVEELHLLLTDAIELFGATSRSSHIIQTSLNPAGCVRANGGAVQHLILNLLQNAADASPHGSIIRVTTFPSANGAVLEVTDRGAGISEDVRSRMYDPLFTTKVDGTGLGLDIVKRIVAEHEGTIECESTVGKGTTFRITIPHA